MRKETKERINGGFVYNKATEKNDSIGNKEKGKEARVMKDNNQPTKKRGLNLSGQHVVLKPLKPNVSH